MMTILFFVYHLKTVELYTSPSKVFSHKKKNLNDINDIFINEL